VILQLFSDLVAATVKELAITSSSTLGIRRQLRSDPAREFQEHPLLNEEQKSGIEGDTLVHPAMHFCPIHAPGGPFSEYAGVCGCGGHNRIDLPSWTMVPYCFAGKV
jgi:hypothetical protein